MPEVKESPRTPRRVGGAQGIWLISSPFFLPPRTTTTATYSTNRPVCWWYVAEAVSEHHQL